MSTPNSRLSIAELMKLKFDEVQSIMMEREKKMEMEMGSLVKFHHVLKKEINTLESSKSIEKCSLEEKLRRSEMRCEALEKRFTQKQEENEKLLVQKWDAEEKLEKSVTECEELRSEIFQAYQRMEEKHEKLNREKLDVEEKLERSERKCKELMSENLDANQRMEELQRKNVEAVEELRVEKMESDKAAQLYKSRFHDLELKMMNVRTQAHMLNVNLANLVDSMDKTAAAATDVDLPDSFESGEVNAAAGDGHAISAEVRVTGGDSGGIGLSKKGAIGGTSLIRRCDLRIINKIKKNLAKENLEMFEQSCFGHLLKMDHLHYQGQLMLMLLLHIDMGASNKERLVFKINNSNIEFGYDDFCRITGLCFGTPEATAIYSSIQVDVFQGRSSIRLKDVEVAFLKFSSDHEDRGELTLKLALLYFLYGTLLARHPLLKRSDLEYLHLIDDLHKFNAFPWGRVAYEFLVSSILWARDHMDDSESSYKRKNIEICGFIFALQIWAYEVMPSVATYCASRADNFETLRPHILRWTPATYMIHFNHLKKFFVGGDQTHLGPKGLQRCSSFAAEDVIFICDSDDEIPDSPAKRNVAVPPIQWNRKRKRSTYGCIKSEETAAAAAAAQELNTVNDEDLSGLQS